MRVYGIRHKPTGEMLICSERYDELGRHHEELFSDENAPEINIHIAWPKHLIALYTTPRYEGAQKRKHYDDDELEIVKFDLTEVQEQIPEGEGKG